MKVEVKSYSSVVAETRRLLPEHRTMVLQALREVRCTEPRLSRCPADTTRFLGDCIELIAKEMMSEPGYVEDEYELTYLDANSVEYRATFLMPESECEIIWGSTLDEQIGYENCIINITQNGEVIRESTGEVLTPCVWTSDNTILPGRYVLPVLFRKGGHEWVISNPRRAS